MPSYVVPSCCLTWHSSCKVSLFTFWNLSQVVILKLERCSFLFLEAYSVLHNFALFIFLNLQICPSSVVPNFKWLSCKVSFFTLWNASEVTILELYRCVFFYMKVYLVFHISLLFIFFQFENFALHQWTFF